MRGKSHQFLGRYLVTHYLSETSPACQKAFLTGCVEPDRNPATYLKGSIRCQWLRGHNYRNARRFMCSISRRLERKQKLRIYDFYTMGKLIHYTADAFTHAHNDRFSSGLSSHRAYESSLQNHFLAYLAQNPPTQIRPAKSVMDAIYRYHREYELQDSGIATDSRFALSACCCVMNLLFPKPVC